MCEKAVGNGSISLGKPHLSEQQVDGTYCYSKYYIIFLSKFISFPSRLQLHLEIFQPTFTYKCEFFKNWFYWHSYTGKHSHGSALLSVQVGIAVSAFKFQLIAKITEEERKNFQYA